MTTCSGVSNGSAAFATTRALPRALPRAFVSVANNVERSVAFNVGSDIRIGNQTNSMTSAAGYASSSLTPVHFGGLAEKADVEIRWPSGVRQMVNGVATSRAATIAEEWFRPAGRRRR